MMQTTTKVTMTKVNTRQLSKHFRRREALVEDQLTDEILQLINLVCEDLSVGELDCD